MINNSNRTRSSPIDSPDLKLTPARARATPISKGAEYFGTRSPDPYLITKLLVNTSLRSRRRMTYVIRRTPPLLSRV
ncbi:hypothetical protein PUN28_017500 [Cardiocondyla obscurior]|uniref:Uncharacterized protein n=1 Tax=Cardiocondyla obscurior TaxID=286306 RepID=A0AAW2EMY3_9HYME